MSEAAEPRVFAWWKLCYFGFMCGLLGLGVLIFLGILLCWFVFF